MKSQTEFMEICRKIGWKCTAQRLAVYGFLHKNRTHPDVDAVWGAVRETLPTITRESVYRILNEFSEQGIIGRLDHIDSARYDSRPDAHGHFICRECGGITDFDWPENAVLPPEVLRNTIRHLEIRIVGLCRECEQKNKCVTGTRQVPMRSEKNNQESEK